jgi:hypothetical protein
VHAAWSRKRSKEFRSVLLVSPVEPDHATARLILESCGWKVHRAKTVSEAVAVLLEESVPVVICARELAGGTWKTLDDSLRFLRDRPNLIIAAQQLDRQLCDEVNDRPGYDVLSTPFKRESVIPAVQLARSNWLRNGGQSRGHVPFFEGVLSRVGRAKPARQTIQQTEQRGGRQAA